MTAKDCVYLVAKAWDKVLESTLFKTWNKVFTTRESAEDGESHRSWEAKVSHSPLPQELDNALSAWEISDASDTSHENLSDEAMLLMSEEQKN